MIQPQHVLSKRRNGGYLRIVAPTRSASSAKQNTSSSPPSPRMPKTTPHVALFSDLAAKDKALDEAPSTRIVDNLIQLLTDMNELSLSVIGRRIRVVSRRPPAAADPGAIRLPASLPPPAP